MEGTPKNRFFLFLPLKIFDMPKIIRNWWTFQRNHLFYNRRKIVATRAIFRFFIHGRAHSGKKCDNHCNFVRNMFKSRNFRIGIPQLVIIFQTDLKSTKICALSKAFCPFFCTPGIYHDFSIISDGILPSHRGSQEDDRKITWLHSFASNRIQSSLEW